MDPQEAMKRLRDAMIEVSDLTSYLRVEGSVLRKDQIEAVVDSAEDVVAHGKDLLDFLGKGGYLPARG